MFLVSSEILGCKIQIRHFDFSPSSCFTIQKKKHTESVRAFVIAYILNFYTNKVLLLLKNLWENDFVKCEVVCYYC